MSDGHISYTMRIDLKTGEHTLTPQPSARASCSARLRFPGMPVCTNPPEYGAVWRTDNIIPIHRLGSHWLCTVIFGSDDFPRSMTALIHKRALRIRPNCNTCGQPATCLGSYEDNDAPNEFACDDCCGHGCEDGHCTPIRQNSAINHE